MQNIVLFDVSNSKDSSANTGSKICSWQGIGDCAGTVPWNKWISLKNNSVSWQWKANQPPRQGFWGVLRSWTILYANCKLQAIFCTLHGSECSTAKSVLQRPLPLLDNITRKEYNAPVAKEILPPCLRFVVCGWDYLVDKVAPWLATRVRIHALCQICHNSCRSLLNLESKLFGVKLTSKGPFQIGTW